MENGTEYNTERIYNGKIKPEFITRAIKAYNRYKGEKGELDNRVINNNKWYKARYKGYDSEINPKTNETEPATPFIFSAIENKYADAIDNFPTPNLLEREPSDSKTAQLLSKIIPVQLDTSGFKKVYKDNWRRKLKHGTAIYGVFYDEAGEDIKIKAIDILSIYCDMHVRDVQDSQFLFITQAVDNDILREQYPKYASLFNGDTSIKDYSGTHTAEDKTEVVDCYYKKPGSGLHLMKLVSGEVIDATEDTEGYEKGLYAHGLYPVIFDVLYPEEDSPFGLGIVDIIRDPQMYIDKLDSVIIKNAVIAGKHRWIMKDGSGINEKELLDYSIDVIHSSLGVDDDNLRAIQAKGLPSFIIEHRTEKINELKEVIGNRDFQQGATSGGVSAASAITALQQAGEKLSRAIIDDSYDAYKTLVIMCIELMREFYDKERVYRITNELGQTEFKVFSNALLKREFVEDSITPESDEQSDERDALGFAADGARVEFDIDVVPQRQNPFSREANNQTVLALWGAGLFAPANADIAVIALQAMNFDGKEKLIENIQSLSEQMKQQAAAQQAAAQQAANEAYENNGQDSNAAGDLVPIGRVGGENGDLVPIGKIGG